MNVQRIANQGAAAEADRARGLGLGLAGGGPHDPAYLQLSNNGHRFAKPKVNPDMQVPAQLGKVVPGPRADRPGACINANGTSAVVMRQTMSKRELGVLFGNSTDTTQVPTLVQ